MSVKLKIMTFNLRVVSKSDGINIFYNRKNRILETINNENPDLIGFQEANDEMRDWLRDSLQDYTIVGCGRYKDYRGESTVLAFKKDMFLMISSETFWLSATPLLPASTFGGDQSHCPRICTAARLKHKDAESVIWFYNTHTDHKGKTARLLGAIEVMQHISAHVDPDNEKVVITGDMNALPDTPEIQAFTTSLCDRTIVDATSEVGGTFHGFGTKEIFSKIDYIFTDAKTNTAEAYSIKDQPVDGIYISDHMPVCAFIELN